MGLYPGSRKFMPCSVKRGMSPFGTARSYEHWVSRIAVRTCYDALRKQRHDKRHLPLDDLASEPKDLRIDDQLSAAEARSVDVGRSPSQTGRAARDYPHGTGREISTGGNRP
jgi:hypothetical protein